jgi:hypothetical protein
MLSCATTLERLRRLATHAAIVVLLGFMLLQAFPGVPYWLNWRVYELADLAGLTQGTWSMFAPNPDRANHRVRVLIDYADGTKAQWLSPDWQKMGLGKRFVGARHLELIDAIDVSDYSPALDDLADWLARTEAASPGAAPRRVEIWLDQAEILDPRINGWQPRSAHLPLDKHTLIFEEDYP